MFEILEHLSYIFFPVIGIKSFLLYAKETEIRGQLFERQSTQALAPISKILSASALDFHAGKAEHQLVSLDLLSKKLIEVQMK